MTETDMKRPWWLAVVTIPNVLALGSLLIGGAMTYQAQIQRVAVTEDRIARAESRLATLEDRLDQAIADTANVYMRKDLIAAELTAIREQIQLLRRDLR